jgi:two-component system CheB/CheR fusion protein
MKPEAWPWRRTRSAKYDGMPRAAVETSCIDAILSPEQMAKELPQILLDHLARLKYSHDDTEKLLQDTVKLLKEKHGTDFSQYKMNTLRPKSAPAPRKII